MHVSLLACVRGPVGGFTTKDKPMPFLTILQLILTSFPTITAEVLTLIKQVEAASTTSPGTSTPVADGIAVHVAAGK